MKRLLIGAGYAIAGLGLAVGLTFGAYAVAGRDLSKPARPVRVPAQLAPVEAIVPSPSPSVDDSSSPGVDDRGGDRPREDRSGNSGRGSDSSGSGRSGSGSDD